ncbi:MAG: MFS transporter [Nocardioides sp.]|nr:MFS transporter [Nocardioides sp.]
MTERRAPTWAVILTLSLAGMLASLQQTLVVPVLAEVPGLFEVSSDTGTWMVTVTLLAAAVGTPIISRMADMYGKRRMILLTMSIMVLGSLLLALGDSFALALTGRAMQGLASALIPVGISIMRDELPPERVGFGVALMSATLGIGASMGMPLSGLLYSHFGWSSLFWVSGAAGAAMLAAVALLVRESEVKAPGRFDLRGSLLFAAALTAFLLAVSKGGAWGWGSPQVLGLAALTAVLLAAWLPYELRVGDPLVDLRTSARRPVLLTNIASILIALAMYVNILISISLLELPEETGHGLGLDVSSAGLAMVPSGLVMVLLSPFSGMILNRWGGRLTMAVGAAIMSVTYLLRIPFSGSVTEVVLGSALVGLGTALAFAAMPMLIMAAVPITETAAANGINALMRSVGGATSSAVFAAITASVTVSYAGEVLPAKGAFDLMFTLCGAATLMAVGVTWLIPARAAREDRGRGSIVSPDRGRTETVVRGTILIGGEQPSVTPTIVTVTRLDGNPIDWARCDQSGRYSVAQPGPGKYVVVANARGWGPQAQIIDFAGGAASEDLTLEHQLTLSGTVTEGGVPVSEAMVALHQGGGEFVLSGTTDWQGRYRLPLPPPGYYVLTAASDGSDAAGSRKVNAAAQGLVVDVDLATGRAPSR